MGKQYDKRIKRDQRRPGNGNTHQFTQNNTKKISNWKTPGHDGIHSFWSKKFTSIHDWLALEINSYMEHTYLNGWAKERPHWSRRTQSKEPPQTTADALSAYRWCGNINSTNKGRDLLLANKLWIVPWGTEGMLQSIQRHRRFTLHRSAHPKREQDQMEKSSYGLDWLQKVYDKVPQSWIINCPKMYKISDEVINFIDKTMKTWRVELTAWGKSLAEGKIQRGIFLGDAQSSLLFVIAMMPLNHIIRKFTAEYKLSRSQEKINHQMYMEDIKLLAKKWKRTGNSNTWS